MTIQRNGEEQTFSVKTTTLSLPQITSNIYEREDKKSRLISKLKSFHRILQNSFESALKELESDGIDRLIIDVRDNPGGVLNANNRDSIFIYDQKASAISVSY